MIIVIIGRFYTITLSKLYDSIESEFGRNEEKAYDSTLRAWILSRFSLEIRSWHQKTDLQMYPQILFLAHFLYLTMIYGNESREN